MPQPDPLRLALWCAFAFLCGSIPFGLILVKLAGKGDVRAHGSGNIGATNVSRVGGKGLGILTLLLDAAKGFLPVYFGKSFFAGSYGVAACLALGAVIGHMFTPWLTFKGGKGVATALGVALATGGWVAVLPSFAMFLIALLLWRYVSLGSILAALVMPATARVFFWWTKAGDPLAFWGNHWNWLIWAAISALVIVKHGDNIHRLVKGTESKLWGKKAEVTNA
jgi:acyl phosphate:glycerol-3-phosphate acyltransferase